MRGWEREHWHRSEVKRSQMILFLSNASWWAYSLKAGWRIVSGHKLSTSRNVGYVNKTWSSVCVHFYNYFPKGNFHCYNCRTRWNTRLEGAGTYQLLQLPLSVAQLLVHAKANLSAFQCGDDLQLCVVVLDDVVLQHQTQDLGVTE